jgi:hypothetical protein
MLTSGYYENQVWEALHKAWVGYNIAISKWELDNQIKYAKIICKLPRDFGLELSNFKILTLKIENFNRAFLTIINKRYLSLRTEIIKLSFYTFSIKWYKTYHNYYYVNHNFSQWQICNRINLNE